MMVSFSTFVHAGDVCILKVGEKSGSRVIPKVV